MGFFEFLGNLLNPEWIIENGGLYLLLFIIFAETGLFIGFFLPGDTLLFVAGLLGDELSASFYNVPVLVLILLVAGAGVLGNFFGYFFGAYFGPFLYRKQDSWLFKRDHLEKAQAFYKRWGGVAIIMGRFVPIVRTFAPIVAGLIRMELPKFSLFNALGSILWVGSIMVAGYYLGKAFPEVKEYLHYFIFVIILVLLFPLIRSFFTRKKAVETPVDNSSTNDIHNDPMV